MEVYQDRLLVNDHVNMTRNIWESVDTHRPIWLSLTTCG